MYKSGAFSQNTAATSSRSSQVEPSSETPWGAPNVREKLQFPRRLPKHRAHLQDADACGGVGENPVRPEVHLPHGTIVRQERHDHIDLPRHVLQAIGYARAILGERFRLATGVAEAITRKSRLSRRRATPLPMWLRPIMPMVSSGFCRIHLLPRT